MPPFLQSILNSKKAVIGIVIGVVGLIVAIAAFSSVNSVQKDMVSKENALSAQYTVNQNALSTLISTVKETLGVADRNTQALDTVLADALKGRYDGDTSAQPGGGQMFSAIVEAYPDLAGVTDAYAKVQDAIIGGRRAYANKQDKLTDMLNNYITWKNSGFIHSKIASMVGAPSENLVAAIGDDEVTGKAAIKRIRKIVITSEGKKAYESGEMDPMDLNPAPTAPATPQVTTPVEGR